MTRMRMLLVMLAVVCPLASPAAAQEQRGSIEGTVRDASQGVLPGVSVEARSPALVGSQTAITDANGVYRFPALRPGRYEITATLQGFSPARVANVLLELGQVLRIDLSLVVGGVNETLDVRGGPPLIDVKQNAAGANVAREIIERIPKGRDFTAVVTSAPGITDENAQPRHPDRRCERRGQSFPDRRRRHDQPAQRDVR